jgi:hypothetical protein
MAKIKINLHAETVNLLKTHASLVATDSSTYYFIPYWIEEKNGEYFMHNLNDLPDELINEIKKHRHLIAPPVIESDDHYIQQRDIRNNLRDLYEKKSGREAGSIKLQIEEIDAMLEAYERMNPSITATYRNDV